MSAEPAAELGDRALVAGYLAAGDEGAFRALYSRHTPALWPVVLRLVAGDEEAAREAVQETWLRAAARLGSFRWESTLRTWLTGIAINCARDTVRGERRGRAASEVGEPVVPNVESPTGVDSSTGVDLARAVDALPEGYREVLVLHDVEGYTHEEIAAFLGIETGTSKSQLHRARRRLRETLGGQAEGGDG